MSVARTRTQNRATHPQNSTAPTDVFMSAAPGGSLVPSGGTRRSASRPRRDEAELIREQQQSMEVNAWTRFHEELITCRRNLDEPSVELRDYWNILDRVNESIQNFPRAGLPAPSVGPLWKILIKPFIYRLLLFIFSDISDRTCDGLPITFHPITLPGSRPVTYNLYLTRFFTHFLCSMFHWQQLLNALEGWLANCPGSRGINDLVWRYARQARETYQEDVKKALCECLLRLARLLRHTNMTPQDASDMLREWARDISSRLIRDPWLLDEIQTVPEAERNSGTPMLREPDARSDRACTLMMNFYKNAFIETISRDIKSEMISRLAHLSYDIIQKITQHLEQPCEQRSFEELELEALWDMLERENPSENVGRRIQRHINGRGARATRQLHDVI
jgi:hypothetical protein